MDFSRSKPWRQMQETEIRRGKTLQSGRDNGDSANITRPKRVRAARPSQEKQHFVRLAIVPDAGRQQLSKGSWLTCRRTSRKLSKSTMARHRSLATCISSCRGNTADPFCLARFVNAATKVRTFTRVGIETKQSIDVAAGCKKHKCTRELPNIGAEAFIRLQCKGFPESDRCWRSQARRCCI